MVLRLQANNHHFEYILRHVQVEKLKNTHHIQVIQFLARASCIKPGTIILIFIYIYILYLIYILYTK